MRKNFWKYWCRVPKEKIAQFYRRFMTVNKLLRWGLIFAIVSVITAEFLLLNSNEWFEHASLRSIYRTLCLSYITSFIFYFLNVHLPNYNAKVKHYQYLNNKIYRLTEIGAGLVLALQRDSMTKKPYEYEILAREEIKTFCEKTRSREKVDFLHKTYANWFNLTEAVDTETKRLVLALLSVKESLDPSVTMELLNLEDSLDRFLVFYKTKNVDNDDLNFCAEGIYRYRVLSDKLAATFLKKYKHHRNEFEASKKFKKLTELNEIKSTITYNGDI
ncbi:hypothetical protein [Priestia filamentosa]|uniref:hypothetical protein n=1 Tax=Priestia filamentosa TaxID=1402861 RepID=UPI0002D95B2A|nr:hypothetical protein [Priestia filamentosa]